MTVNSVARDFSLIGMWGDDASRSAHRLLNGTRRKTTDAKDKLSDWQLIFLQSRANGCFYDVEELLHFNWQWPTHTWFQERLSRRFEE